MDKFRLSYMECHIAGTTGDGGNGCFKVYIKEKSFFVVAFNGGGWEHVSVTPDNQKRKTCPTWEEMCEIKDMFFEPEERVVQYHPPRSEYVNQHPYCLHLWRPTIENMPFPPAIFV